jgi:hypothetical protein
MQRLSRPRELPPQPLAEPGVSLSTHRAPVAPTLCARICRSGVSSPSAIGSQSALSSSGVHPPTGVDLRCDRNNPTPLLGTHYRHVNAHTGRSVLEPCIGTLCLAFLRLAGSLGIRVRVPAVPPKRLNRARALSMPDTTHPVHRFPMGSSQRYLWSLVLMSAVQFRHLNEGSWSLAFSILT